MVDGVGGPGGPGGFRSGPPGNDGPSPPSDPNDPWNLRRLITQGTGASDREKAWREKEMSFVNELDGKEGHERYAIFSRQAREGRTPEDLARTRNLLDLPPGEREAALTKEFQGTEAKAITSIFKAQFNSLIMRNLKNVEEAIKK